MQIITGSLFITSSSSLLDLSIKHQRFFFRRIYNSTHSRRIPHLTQDRPISKNKTCFLSYFSYEVKKTSFLLFLLEEEKNQKQKQFRE